jgi:hypothetical protein
MQNNAKKILKITFLSVFFLFILIFTFFNSKDLLLGVKIKKVNIINNSKVTESVFEITGLARNAKNLTLNDREISIDQKGNFRETVVLLPGYNLIEIKALDKFGNSDEKNYKLIYEAEIASKE